MNIVNINSNEQENSMRDRSVRDIHLEKAFVYVIDANLKVFAEAIGVLAKISEQILFQPFHDCLVLSAFNSTKSAYGKITFYANFFSRCESNVDVDGLGVGGDITCRISARSALHIFKNVCTRSGGLHMPGFDLCQLEFDPRADFAIVHLQQQPAQIKRAFLLPMKEQTVTFDNIFTEKHRLKNRLSTQARLFLNMFAGLDCQQFMFPARLLASSTQFSAHRYISREDLNKVRKTEVTIPVENFELYHVHLNTQIVISLRELRSILNFMESCGLSLSLHFDRAGRPLIVALEDNLDFGAEFVLATLDDGEREQQRTVPDQQQANLVLLAQNPSQRVQMTPGMEPESRPSIAKRLLALASLQTEEEANENRYSASFC